MEGNPISNQSDSLLWARIPMDMDVCVCLAATLYHFHNVKAFATQSAIS